MKTASELLSLTKTSIQKNLLKEEEQTKYLLSEFERLATIHAEFGNDFIFWKFVAVDNNIRNQNAKVVSNVFEALIKNGFYICDIKDQKLFDQIDHGECSDISVFVSWNDEEIKEFGKVKKCSDCEDSLVLLKKGEDRKYFVVDKYRKIPDDFLIPTCNKCSSVYIDNLTIKRIECLANFIA